MPCYTVQTRRGVMFLHGDLGEHCADCGDVGSLLCDYPIGGGKTCDRKLCEGHAHLVGDDIHYCRSHFREWQTDNPDKPTYRHTHLQWVNLPGMAQTALTFLKQEFDRRDPGERSHLIHRFLRNSAIQLGRDASRAVEDHIEDAPHESLAGALQWSIRHGLAEVYWKPQRQGAALPCFALTRAGLSVLEGGVVEVKRESDTR